MNKRLCLPKLAIKERESLDGINSNTELLPTARVYKVTQTLNNLQPLKVFFTYEDWNFLHLQNKIHACHAIVISQVVSFQDNSNEDRQIFSIK